MYRTTTMTFRNVYSRINVVSTLDLKSASQDVVNRVKQEDYKK